MITVAESHQVFPEDCRPIYMGIQGFMYHHGKDETQYKAWVLERLKARDPDVVWFMNDVYMHAKSDMHVVLHSEGQTWHCEIVKAMITEKLPAPPRVSAVIIAGAATVGCFMDGEGVIIDIGKSHQWALGKRFQEVESWFKDKGYSIVPICDTKQNIHQETKSATLRDLAVGGGIQQHSQVDRHCRGSHRRQNPRG